MCACAVLWDAYGKLCWKMKVSVCMGAVLRDVYGEKCWKIVKIRDFVTRRGRWAAAGLVMLFYRFLPVRWQCSISGVSVLEIECISPSGGGRNARDGGHALISVSPRQAILLYCK